MDAFLTKSCTGVVAEPGIVRAEVPQREAVQVPAVRGIAERAEVGVVRRRDVHRSAGLQQPVELFDGADHVGDMLDDVDRADVIEALIAERVREPVYIHDRVRRRARNPIDADRAGILVYPATDVEDALSRSCTRILRHSSSVSTAKSA